MQHFSVVPPASGGATMVTEASSNASTSFHHGITYTSYEVNTFQLKFNSSGVRVLVDPWFVDNLTFADQDWVYRGTKRVIGRSVKVDLDQLAAETDVLVITQGLPDHTHLPTLRAFPKHVPVIANPSAAELIRPLGYSSVRVLDHGQSCEVAGREGQALRITATVGASVGPPWSKRQNGLVFKELAASGSNSSQQQQDGPSVYFESHCDFDPASVKRVGKVDVVISPVNSTLLGVGPAAYPLTRGDHDLVQLLNILQPRVLIPLLNSDIEHHGPLVALMQERGSMAPDAVAAKLAGAGLGRVKVEFPAPPGEAIAVAL